MSWPDLLNPVEAGARSELAKQVPSLEAGDHLTATEFHRRYEAMPHVKKAELIDGVVFMPSPATADGHAEPQGDFMAVVNYRAFTPGVQGGDNGTVKLDDENELQPDAYLRILPEFGGQCRVIDRYINGAPKWVAEIAASSANYDLHEKKEVYRRFGVREYVVWRVLDREIDWFALRDGDFVRMALEDDGIYRSEVLPGLWLNAHELIDGNVAAVIETLQQGMKSEEHVTFVERLKSARSVVADD